MAEKVYALNPLLIKIIKNNITNSYVSGTWKKVNTIEPPPPPPPKKEKINRKR